MNHARALGYCVSTLAIYLGLSLLGWGLDDLGGFFAGAPRVGYAAAAAAFALAVGVQALDAPEGIRGARGEAGKRVGRQTMVIAAMSLTLFAALALLPFAARRGLGLMPDMPAVQWAGVALSALGYALVFWSGVALGRMYSKEVTIQKDHQLITTGLYGVIRHPRYLGVLLLALGVPLVFGVWPGLAVTVLVTGVLALRIRDEEALMRREFGAEWDAYCRRSARLIPFVY